MNKIPLAFAILVSTSCIAQGIQFEKNSTWKQILQKAKTENKYIFLDCYATWCGPCKMMDENVYPRQEVGAYYNAHFISVKAQMDRTEQDDSSIRKWYRDAAAIATAYSVHSLPTFLFFSPDGAPAHKITGSMDANSFIEVGRDAQNPAKQYYAVLRNYQPGKLETSELRALSIAFRYSDSGLSEKLAMEYFTRIPPDSFGNRENLDLANVFRRDSLITGIMLHYLTGLNREKLQAPSNLHLLRLFKDDNAFKSIANRYINSLSKADLLTKENVYLVHSFLASSSDRGFQLFFQNSKTIDKLTTKGYAEASIDKIITKEDINPSLVAAKKTGTEPDWKRLSKDIQVRYGKSYAKRTVLAAKPAYFREIRHWNDYAYWLTQYINQYATITPDWAFYLNNMAWEIFENTGNKALLTQANKWMTATLRSDSTSAFYGGYMDTKANILYRMGRTNEAIALEEQAIALERRRDPTTASYAKTLDKMKRNEPTWANKQEGN